ncbi:hypothetical protein DPMN_051752 [Dreissena polymorpha]|uniref:Uncharacterized protein n=1 Tax=Dreissena polymorpha TaxID=45954 RepID=A0A9D4CIE7_DREPO|nr:hypothetical protein DPMN_051752 [Dreissena polymorpha]
MKRFGPLAPLSTESQPMSAQGAWSWLVPLRELACREQDGADLSQNVVVQLWQVQLMVQ